jgi:hypothetical protein
MPPTTHKDKGKNMTQKVPQLNQAESDRSIKRIKQLLETALTYREMADKLNAEGFKNNPSSSVDGAKHQAGYLEATPPSS